MYVYINSNYRGYIKLYPNLTYEGFHNDTFGYHPINGVITDLKLADGNNCN